mmetsp:Transcript_12077/g.44823  ORF Transcript_12077/g.44823 Transcript_12077/m.44823 type:complete len:357 (-) Transcript_12077:189-1259(-)
MLLACSGNGVVVLRHGRRFRKPSQRLLRLFDGTYHRADPRENFKLTCREQIAAHVSLILLQVWPRSEVSRPHAVLAVAVGKEVVGLGPVLDASVFTELGILRQHVVFGRGVERIDAAVGVHVVNQPVQVRVDVRRGLIVEVHPKSHHDVLSLRLRGLAERLLHKRVHALGDVVFMEARIVHQRDHVGVADIEVEPFWRSVVPVVAARETPEDGVVLTERRRRLPEPLAALLPLPLLPVLIVNPPKEKRVETRLVGHERGLGGRVAKRVDLPPNSWLDPELGFEESVAEGRLVHHGDVVGRSLVVHAPATVGEAQALFFDQFPDHFLLVVLQFCEPSREERHFDIRKAPLRSLLQLS